jgi:hypothetical protein
MERDSSLCGAKRSEKSKAIPSPEVERKPRKMERRG